MDKVLRPTLHLLLAGQETVPWSNLVARWVLLPSSKNPQLCEPMSNNWPTQPFNLGAHATKVLQKRDRGVLEPWHSHLLSTAKKG